MGVSGAGLSGGDADVDVARQGGDGFFARLEQLRESKSNMMKALEELQLGQAAKAALAEAQFKLEETQKEIEELKAKAHEDAYQITLAAEAAALKNTNEVETYCADLKAKTEEELFGRKASFQAWEADARLSTQTALDQAKTAQQEAESTRQDLRNQLKASEAAEKASNASKAKADATEKALKAKLDKLGSAIADVA